MTVVSVKSLCKAYGQKKVLRDVSFDIQKGEVFGLLGSNGAGKSTLTRIILGLENQTSGKVNYSTGQLNKSKISLVPQDLAFYKEFTVKKNLEYFASIYGLNRKETNSRTNFLLDWLELKGFENVIAANLSGGYQRLLNIAVALLHDPDLIFFDEPTVALDPRMRRMFWDKINDLKDHKKTIILTTHYMDEAQALCSRVALLKNGRLIALGSPAQLIKENGGKLSLSFKLSKEISEVDFEELKKFMNNNNLIAHDQSVFIPLVHGTGKIESKLVSEWIAKKDYKLISSTTKEPNLEDVFLNLTGEKMGESHEIN